MLWTPQQSTVMGSAVSCLRGEEFEPQRLQSGPNSALLPCQCLETSVWLRFVLESCPSQLQRDRRSSDQKPQAVPVYASLLPCAGVVGSFMPLLPWPVTMLHAPRRHVSLYPGLCNRVMD